MLALGLYLVGHRDVAAYDGPEADRLAQLVDDPKRFALLGDQHMEAVRPEIEYRVMPLLALAHAFLAPRPLLGCER